MRRRRRRIMCATGTCAGRVVGLMAALLIASIARPRRNCLFFFGSDTDGVVLFFFVAAIADRVSTVQWQTVIPLTVYL